MVNVIRQFRKETKNNGYDHKSDMTVLALGTEKHYFLTSLVGDKNCVTVSSPSLSSLSLCRCSLFGCGLLAACWYSVMRILAECRPIAVLGRRGGGGGWSWADLSAKVSSKENSSLLARSTVMSPH